MYLIVVLVLLSLIIVVIPNINARRAEKERAKRRRGTITRTFKSKTVVKGDLLCERNFTSDIILQELESVGEYSIVKVVCMTNPNGYSISEVQEVVGNLIKTAEVKWLQAQ